MSVPDGGTFPRAPLSLPLSVGNSVRLTPLRGAVAVAVAAPRPAPVRRDGERTATAAIAAASAQPPLAEGVRRADGGGDQLCCCESCDGGSWASACVRAARCKADGGSSTSMWRSAACGDARRRWLTADAGDAWRDDEPLVVAGPGLDGPDARSGVAVGEASAYAGEARCDSRDRGGGVSGGVLDG